MPTQSEEAIQRNLEDTGFNSLGRGVWGSAKPVAASQCDHDGQVIPTGVEGREIERQGREVERQRAERLAERLQEMGINPDEVWVRVLPWNLNINTDCPILFRMGLLLFQLEYWLTDSVCTQQQRDFVSQCKSWQILPSSISAIPLPDFATFNQSTGTLLSYSPSRSIETVLIA